MDPIKKRILVIGSKGMAGHVIYHYLKSLKEYHVADISRNNAYFISTYTIVDITEFNSLLHVLETEHPDIVINCIGVLIQNSESNPDRAILINSYLPHYLARKGRELGYKLIHIGTDSVFSGKKGHYKETDIQDGIGSYAQSKMLGEVTYDGHITLRTSLIGPELKSNGVGLFHWFMQQTGHIKGYTNAIWTGITTIELAHLIHKVMEEEISGLCHMVNNETISKYELIRLCKEVFERKDIVLEMFEEYRVDKSLVNTKIDFNIKSYNDMISDMKYWMEQHKNLYQNYF